MTNLNQHTDIVPVPTYENVISGSKYESNNYEELTKSEAIEQLKNTNSKTYPIVIAKYLEIIFGTWEDNPEHWLQLANKYTPKAINSVIHEMQKLKDRTGITQKTPGRLFTYLLKSFHTPRRHTKRKVYRDDIERNKYGIYRRKDVC